MNITEEKILRITLTMTREEAQHLLECVDVEHAVAGYYELSDDSRELHSVLCAFIKESPAERDERIDRHNRLERLCDQQRAEALAALQREDF